MQNNDLTLQAIIKIFKKMEKIIIIASAISEFLALALMSLKKAALSLALSTSRARAHQSFAKIEIRNRPRDPRGWSIRARTVSRPKIHQKSENK